jgi:hypothetical protein
MHWHTTYSVNRPTIGGVGQNLESICMNRSASRFHIGYMYTDKMERRGLSLDL